MKHKFFSALIAMVSALLFISTAARAQTLPPAGFFASVSGSFGGLFLGQPGSISDMNCNPGPCGTNTATLGENFASVSASTVGSAVGPNASLSYFVEVDGPAYALVPLHLVANLATTAATNSSIALASITMPQSVGFGETLRVIGTGYESCAGQGCADGACLANCTLPITDGLSLDTTLSLESDTPTQITLDATCAASGSGSCSASADPMISIDPGFLADNPGFSLEFSAGIINAAGGGGGGGGGVPEPTTWAMMLAGLAGIGGVLRRRGGSALAAG